MISINKLGKIYIAAILFISNASYSYAMDEDSNTSFRKTLNSCMQKIVDQAEAKNQKTAKPLQNITNVPSLMKSKMILNEVDEVNKKFKHSNLSYRHYVNINDCMQEVVNEVMKENKPNLRLGLNAS